MFQDEVESWLTLRYLTTVDIYLDNKISIFKVNLSQTLQVDPEYWEVALKEIQFPHLWCNVIKDENYFIGRYNTIIGRPFNKRVEFKFMMTEIKPGRWTERKNTSRT